LQGGAMGLPSIVTNVNGCNEIITEGFNGTIIPVKNKDAIVAAMLDFTANGKISEVKKLEIREHISSNYSQQLVWSAVKEEYDRLIEVEKN
jgi:glycosyltransferase involved in cell wall biosynthesis